mgnify:CR=1 FL=1
MNKKQREFFLESEGNTWLKFNNKTVRNNKIGVYE